VLTPELRAAIEHAQYHAVLAVPLLVQDRVVGEAAAIMRRVKTFAEATTLSGAVPLDLNQLVRDLLGARGAQWADAVADTNIELAFEPGEIPKVFGLPTPLREELVVLILNAVEALPDGGRILVRTWAAADAVYCAVGDSGPGMSDEVRHRACEPFFSTKGPRHQGLGLSLAHGIIRRHCGELEIPRNAGQGGVVTFHLPPHRRAARSS
jgi:signal transduction histidine kinase